MNIALLTTGFLKGGKEATSITLMEFARELKRNGHDVTIISEKRKEDVRWDSVEGIKVYRVGFLNSSGEGSKMSIYNRIIAHALGIRRVENKLGKKFEVIHSFSAAPILALRSILSRTFSNNARIVHTLKSYSRNGAGAFFYKVLNAVDHITVPTETFAKLLIRKGVAQKKIAVIRSHINTKRFKPRDREALKEKYGFPGKKIVLYYGAMWENKGTHHLIEAIPAIANGEKDAVFIFAPRNMPYAEKFRKPLAELELENGRVIITREIDVAEYVAMADVVALPYATMVGTEGNPSCLLEAMACKTPVVTTSFPELQEIAVPGEDVLMVAPGDVPRLAAAILTLLQDTKTARRLAENAYRKTKKFDTSLITAQFLELYTKHDVL